MSLVWIISGAPHEIGGGTSRVDLPLLLVCNSFLDSGGCPELAPAISLLPPTSWRAGTTPPTVQTLAKWKKAVFGLSTEAFSAVGEVYNSREKGIDASAVSLNFLTKKNFIDLKETATAQALAVHMIARCDSAALRPTYTGGLIG